MIGYQILTNTINHFLSSQIFTIRIQICDQKIIIVCNFKICCDHIIGAIHQYGIVCSFNHFFHSSFGIQAYGKHSYCFTGRILNTTCKLDHIF